MQGMGLEQYLKMTGTEMGAFRAMFKDQAGVRLRPVWHCRRLLNWRGITVSDKGLRKSMLRWQSSTRWKLGRLKAIVSKGSSGGRSEDLERAPSSSRRTPRLRRQQRRRLLRRPQSNFCWDSQSAQTTAKPNAEALVHRKSAERRSRFSIFKEDKICAFSQLIRLAERSFPKLSLVPMVVEQTGRGERSF